MSEDNKKKTVAHLIKKNVPFYELQRFIIVFKKAGYNGRDLSPDSDTSHTLHSDA
jgi:hypothetical protein